MPPPKPNQPAQKRLTINLRHEKTHPLTLRLLPLISDSQDRDELFRQLPKTRRYEKHTQSQDQELRAIGYGAPFV